MFFVGLEAIFLRGFIIPMEFQLLRVLRTFLLNLFMYILGVALLKDDFICGITGTSADGDFQAYHSAEKEFRQFDVTLIQIFSNGSQIESTLLPTKGHLETITMEFTAFDANFRLILTLNRQLFSAKYVEKSIYRNREVFHNRFTDKHDALCYYSGHIDGQPGSVVAISTCNGVRGYIVTDQDGYHIEPQQYPSSVISQHLIFRDSDYINSNLSCGQQGIPYHFGSLDSRKMRRSLSWPYDANDKTLIVELYVANDHSQFLRFNQNMDEVIRRTKDIVNIVSSLYRPLNMYVALVGVEVWIDKNEIDIVENADKTMNNFLEYRRQHISPKHPNDNAQLITGQALGDGVVGKAPIMTICTWQYSGGVNLDHSSLVGPVATTVAHEMGHNFGLTHDTETCGCPDDRCIMAPSSGGLKNPTKWSECSKQQFVDAFHQGMDYCLHNLPLELFGGAICGNGLMEDGEQCDCGLPQDCTNTCCNATTCRLLPNATCAMGECCDQSTCQPKAIATECRYTKGVCDLAEYCNGLDEICPSDAFKQDGAECLVDGVDAYCYKGRCESHDNQCKLLWGGTGKVSHRLCFEHFNIMGTANGHCGFNWVDNKSFKKCEQRDAMCGMLHCRHHNEKLMFWKEALAYALPEAWVTMNSTRLDCKGVILDVGLDMPDPGMVPNGAKCGDRKVCVNHECRDISSLGLQKCPDCHGHGVCNSLGQCHCDIHYAPPFCDRAGNGGSDHSGPISIFKPNVVLIIGMCFFFVVIVPLVIVLAICGYRHHEKIKRFWLAQQSDKYRSVYRANPRNDTERPCSTIVRKGFQPPPPPAKLPEHESWMRPSSVAIVGKGFPPVRPVDLKRSPNLRTQDVASPRIHSAGCNLPQVPITMKPKSTAGDADISPSITSKAGIGSSGSNDEEKLVPTRVAPAPPPFVSGKHHHHDLGNGPSSIVLNGFVTPKRRTKRSPAMRTSTRANKLPNASASKLPYLVNMASEECIIAGNGTHEHEELPPTSSPTIPPPDPPDSRHRFYSLNNAKSIGQTSGNQAQVPANSNHIVSHRRKQFEMQHRGNQEERPTNSCKPVSGKRERDKAIDLNSAQHTKGPSLGNHESFGNVYCPPISGQRLTTSNVSRSHKC